MSEFESNQPSEDLQANLEGQSSRTLDETAHNPEGRVEQTSDIELSENISEAHSELVDSIVDPSHPDELVTQDSAEYSEPITEKEFPEAYGQTQKEIDRGIEGTVNDPTKSGSDELGGHTGVSTGDIAGTIGAGYGEGSWSDMEGATPPGEKDLSGVGPDGNSAVSEGPTTQGPTLVIDVSSGGVSGPVVDGGGAELKGIIDASETQSKMENIMENVTNLANSAIANEKEFKKRNPTLDQDEDAGGAEPLPSNPADMDAKYDPGLVSLTDPDSMEAGSADDMSVQGQNADKIEAALDTQREISQTPQQAGAEVITDPPEGETGENPKG